MRSSFRGLMRCAVAVLVPALAGGQTRKLKVISSDSAPVVYAYVSIDGGTGQISDEKGEISLGAGKKKTVSVHARRIGYEQFFGKIELPDTAATITIFLPRLTQALGSVQITGRAAATPFLQPFYDRWLMRQKGLLSATFISPEEIEFRHPNKITNMLSGLNGVSFRRTTQGDLVAFGYNNQCQMAVLLDGVQLCPGMGCKCQTCGANIVQIGSKGYTNPSDTAQLTELNSVPIDRLIEAGSVAGIEVYSRGANMPISLQVADAGCGAIAFWTGSRRP
jgi:hypothetical protein